MLSTTAYGGHALSSLSEDAEPANEPFELCAFDCRFGGGTFLQPVLAVPGRIYTWRMTGKCALCFKALHHCYVAQLGLASQAF